MTACRSLEQFFPVNIKAKNITLKFYQEALNLKAKNTVHCLQLQKALQEPTGTVISFLVYAISGRHNYDDRGYGNKKTMRHLCA